MKFKKKYLLIISIFILLCSFVKFQNNLKTGFSETCLKICKDYKRNNYEHGHVYNHKTKDYLDLSEFSVILNETSKYDLSKAYSYKVKTSKIGKIERTTWKSLSKKNKLVSLEKVIFKTEAETEVQGAKYKNKITIVDYYIIRKDTPKKINLRVVNNNELEELSIGNTKYTTTFESYLLGLDETEIEFNKLVQKK